MRQNLKIYLQKLLGEEYVLFEKAGPEPPTIRVNTLVTDVARFLTFLENKKVGFSQHPAISSGFVLDEDFLPLSQTLPFFFGEFFYQGFSSQLPVIALDPQPGENILDIAAAPGSKSTQIAAMMQNRGQLFLNDVSIKRQQSLLTNLSRSGIINDIVLRMPGQRLGRIFPEYFDRVLVDAPCSGISRIGPRDRVDFDATTFVNIQRQLLVSALKAVKAGGTIVYSTCTITPEENEALIDEMIHGYPLQVEEIKDWDYPFIRNGRLNYDDRNYDSTIKNTRRVYPYPQPYETFFVARLRKTDSMSVRLSKQHVHFEPLKSADQELINSVLDWLSARWGIDPHIFSPYLFVLNQKKLWLVAKDQPQIPDQGFIKAGLPLAMFRGNEWKLTNASVHFLGDEIKKSVIELRDQELKNLFREGKMQVRSFRNGYYILQRAQRKIGIISVVNGVMKIHLPHHFDLVL